MFYVCKGQALFGFYFPFMPVALRFTIILLLLEMSSTAPDQLARGCRRGGVSIEAGGSAVPEETGHQEKSRTERVSRSVELPRKI